MKIKKLILENINSLYGRFEIDFSSSALSGSIFAITGPTGSGKSSILDAISLALYGETPRISGGGEKMTEVVSRGASSCLAELTFEIAGKEYLASFGFGSYQRGSKRGELMPIPFHTLSCGSKTLTEKLSLTGKKTVEITGMTPKQFYRAALLAQGQFDAFLRAGQEKAAILEQITGTAIYSDIARKVHEKSRTARELVEKENTLYSAIDLLPAEDEQKKREELEILKTQISAKQKLRKQLEDHQAVFTGLRAQENAQKNNLAEKAALDREQTAFLPDAARLESGERALQVQPYHLRWSELDRELKNAEKLRDEWRNKIPEIQKKHQDSITEQQKAEQALNDRKKQNTELFLLTKKVSALDQALQQNRTASEILAGELGELQEKITTLQKEESSLVQELAELRSSREKNRDYLAGHAGDGDLSVRKARWQEQLLTFHEQQKTAHKCSKEYQNLSKDIAPLEKNADSLQLKLRELDLKHSNALAAEQQLEKELDELLGNSSFSAMEREEELLQKNVDYLRTIQQYEDARKKLADDQPCPLCGSKDHPFAVGNLPQSTREEQELAELRKKLLSCRNKQRELEQARIFRNEQRLLLERGRNEYHLAVSSLEEKLRQQKNLETQLLEQNARVSSLLSALSESFARHGFEWNNTDILPAEIDIRLAAWLEASAQTENSERETGIRETRLSVCRKQLAEYNDNRRILFEKQRSNEEEKNTLQTQRHELFGEKDPDKETEQAQKQQEILQKNFNTACDLLSRITETLRLAAETLSQTETQFSKLAPQTELLYREFLQACKKSNFTPESFSNSCLKDKELAELTGKRASLEQKKRILSEEQIKIEEEIIRIKKHLPAEAEEKIKNDLDRTIIDLQSMQQQTGALTFELEKNDRIRQEQASRLEKLETLRQTAALWSELDSMIGGSDGQRFQRIAQGITLDHLLVNANMILKRMNGRYELIQRNSEKTPLEIDVADHWQGDSIRPSENLSGGERFQVSLSLALGLSYMAGEKIRIDSMFLDEGFGTLDPDSLDLALQTLSTLQRSEGKTIGIISHVQSVGENLPAQIEVIPIGNGRSSLRGAGVKVLQASNSRG